MASPYASAKRRIAPVGPNINPVPLNTPQIGPVAPQPPQQTFGPGNDLRSTQINPSPSARLTGAQGMTGQAAQGVQNFNRGSTTQNYTSQFRGQLAIPSVGARAVNTQVGVGSLNPNVQGRQVNTQVGFQGVNPNVQARRVNTQVWMRNAPSSVGFRGVNPNVAARPAIDPRTSQRFDTLSGQQDSAVSSLTGGPNRTALAQQQLRDFNEQSALDRQQGIRSIGQAAAKFGRIGAGMTTNDLTGLEATIDRNRRFQENDLAASVAEGDINDRFRTVDAVSGLRSQEDSFGRADRGELRDERDFVTGLDERNYGRAANERDTALGLSERNIGRQRDDRDIALGLDEANVGRSMADRDYLTGVDSENVARQMSERDAGLGVSERNVARALSDRDYSTGLDERNVGREFDDRAFTTGLQERNVSRDLADRDFTTGLDERNVGRDFDSRRAALEAAIGMGDREAGDVLDRFGSAGDYESGIYGQEYDARNELRGERGYQEDLARQALENSIRQREMEEEAQQREFQRGYDRSRLGMAGSDQTGAGADGAYDLLFDYLRRRQGSPEQQAKGRK